MKKHVIDGIEVELDDDIDPTEVEAFGADSRTDDDIDLEELEAQALAAPVLDGYGEAPQ